jgi:hypothetical protein
MRSDSAFSVCPVWIANRTSIEYARTFQKCQKPTSARLLDHIVGLREERGRYGKAEGFGSLDVDHQLELRRPPYWLQASFSGADT